MGKSCIGRSRLKPNTWDGNDEVCETSVIPDFATFLELGYATSGWMAPEAWPLTPSLRS
jgi:hypothetical protein